MNAQADALIKINVPEFTTILEKLSVSSKIIDEFRASLLSFNTSISNLRYKILALSIRNIMEQLLEELAPMDQVKTASWFKRKTNDRSRQFVAVKYAIQGAFSDSIVQSQLKFIADKDIGKIANKISMSFDCLEAAMVVSSEPGIDELELLEGILRLKSALRSLASLRFRLRFHLEDAIFSFGISDVCREEISGRLGRYFEDAVIGDYRLRGFDGSHVYVTVCGYYFEVSSSEALHGYGIVEERPFGADVRIRVVSVKTAASSGRGQPVELQSLWMA